MKKLLYLVGFFSVYLDAVPKTVLIIRHGEKTEKDQEVDFKQWHFKKSKPLSVRGWERAHALAPYFYKGSDIVNKYGEIKALFAPKPDNYYKSVRPIETITPLSDLLKIRINTDFALDKDQIPALVKHVKNDKGLHGQVVLIAYEHKHIPELLDAFDVKNHLKKWPSKVFDWVVVLEFDVNSGECVKYKIQPQQLLYGDSKSVAISPCLS